MIFITIGTVKFSFDRLSKFVNVLTQKRSDTKFIIQSGSTKSFVKRPNVEIKKLFTPSQVISFMKKAELVITHGGEGSIYTTLRHSKNKPLVCPRLSRFGEHVDDHQIHFCQLLLSLKAIQLVNLDLNSIHLNIEKNTFNKTMHQSLDKTINRYLDQFTEKLIASQK